jgi:hypothetical protein
MMIEAEMMRKTPKSENWEDVLTSNVFGLYELVNYKNMLEILKVSKNIYGDNLNEELSNKVIKDLTFWHYERGIGEPDIVVKCDDGSFFIIEIKYLSDGEHNKKNIEDLDSSSEEIDIMNEENGQLSKYLDIELIEKYKKSDFIIYLTADYQSLKKIKKSDSSSKNQLNKIYHLHWEDFNKLLINNIELFSGTERRVLEKISIYLNFKGFEPWSGWNNGFMELKTAEYNSFFKASYFNFSFENIDTNIGGFYGNK